jgi:phytanoyl-CoA hydroxylase
MSDAYATLGDVYRRDGYVVVRDFLPPDELLRLRSAVDRFVREIAPTLPDSQVVHQQLGDGRRVLRQIHRMNVDPIFEAYRSHPRWVALAQALVGEPVSAHPPIWLNKWPGAEHPTPPHQDNIAFCLTPPKAVQAFLALEPIDQENGCLRYLPGSHRGGPRPHCYSGIRGFPLGVADYGADEEAAEVAVELQPGDLVCHHPETVHRALPNRSASRSRAAFVMTFVGASARVDPDAMAEFKRNAYRGNSEGR